MACRKIAFKTMEQAERWGKPWYQRAYLCPECGAFHCTKNVQKGEDGQRAAVAREIADRQTRLASMQHDYKMAEQRRKKRR